LCLVMMSISGDEVTVYGGGSKPAYVRFCFLHRDVELPSDEVDFRLVDSPVDQDSAIRTDASKIPGGVSQRDVFGHVASRGLRRAASDAIDMTRRAGLSVLRTSRLDELSEVQPLDKRGPLVIDDGQSGLDPGAHGVFVHAEQVGHLPDGVAAMDFDDPGVLTVAVSPPLMLAGEVRS